MVFRRTNLKYIVIVADDDRRQLLQDNSFFSLHSCDTVAGKFSLLNFSRDAFTL